MGQSQERQQPRRSHDELSVVSGPTEVRRGAEVLQPLSAQTRRDNSRFFESLDHVQTRCITQGVGTILDARQVLRSLALHPTCSSTRMSLDHAVRKVAERVALQVDIADDWQCCAFAGDRGMLHPELTESATYAEAAEVTKQRYDAYASVNRTCEIVLSRATGEPYQHLLEILEQVTRGPAEFQPLRRQLGTEAGTNAVN